MWHSQAEAERRSPSHFGASFLATTSGRKHSAGTGGATAPRPRIPHMAKNMMKRDTEKRHFERQKSSLPWRAKVMFLRTLSTPKVTRAACFESEQKRTHFAARDEKLVHLRASAKPLSSAVLLLHEVAPKICQMARITHDWSTQNSDNIVR